MQTHPDPHGGFDDLVGIEIEAVGPDRCVVTLDIDDNHRQPYGIVHGGVYCVLVESAASIGAALHAMEKGMGGAGGVANTTDFYRSHREGKIRATASPIHQGRSQQVWQVEIVREADEGLLARGQVRLHNLTGSEAINPVPDDIGP